MTIAHSLNIALGGLVLAVILAGLRLWQIDASLQANLLALLPADEHNIAAARASDQLNTALEDEFIFLIGAADSPTGHYCSCAVTAATGTVAAVRPAIRTATTGAKITLPGDAQGTPLLAPDPLAHDPAGGGP